MLCFLPPPPRFAALAGGPSNQENLCKKTWPAPGASPGALIVNQGASARPGCERWVQAQWEDLGVLIVNSLGPPFEAVWFATADRLVWVDLPKG